MKNFVGKSVYDILSHYNIFISGKLQLRFCAKFSDESPGIHAVFCGLGGKYFPCTVLLLYLNRLLKRAPQSPDVTHKHSRRSRREKWIDGHERCFSGSMTAVSRMKAGQFLLRKLHHWLTNMFPNRTHDWRKGAFRQSCVEDGKESYLQYFLI